MGKFRRRGVGKALSASRVVVDDVILYFRHIGEAKLTERTLVHDVSELHAMSVGNVAVETVGTFSPSSTPTGILAGIVCACRLRTSQEAKDRITCLSSIAAAVSNRRDCDGRQT